MNQDANQAKHSEDDNEVTPQHKHRKKIIAETEERKANQKQAEISYELVPSKTPSNKGGKVRKVIRMQNGNVHRLYMGREKQLKELIAKAKKEGRLSYG